VIVLDASALVDVLIGQVAADWVLDQIAEHEVTAPAHQPAEVLSAIARLARAGQLDNELAGEAMDDAMRLPQRLVAPTAHHVRRALALRTHIRVLDGLYVALAEELDCPLVTTDRRLAAAGAPCSIRTPPVITPPR
jgi:predicted nucleic acid-binding protein